MSVKHGLSSEEKSVNAGCLRTGYREEYLLVPETQEGAGGWKKSHILIRNFVFCHLRQIYFADQNMNSPHFEAERRIQNINQKA
jgi:hypothetical protein